MVWHSLAHGISYARTSKRCTAVYTYCLIMFNCICSIQYLPRFSMNLRSTAKVSQPQDGTVVGILDMFVVKPHARSKSEFVYPGCELFLNSFDMSQSLKSHFFVLWWDTVTQWTALSLCESWSQDIQIRCWTTFIPSFFFQFHFVDQSISVPHSNHWANWKCQTRCIWMHSMSLAHISTFDIFPKASMETSKKSQHVIIFASFVLFSLFRLCYPCYPFYTSVVCSCLLIVLFYVKLIASCYCSLLFVCCLLSYVVVFLHISTGLNVFCFSKSKRRQMLSLVRSREWHT